MNQRQDAWSRVEVLAAKNDVACVLLQEAKQPDLLRDGWFCHPSPSEAHRWRISVPRYYLTAEGEQRETKRWFASAITTPVDGVVRPREPMELHEAPDGTFACSHPGQFAVGDLDLSGGRVVTVVSLYGIWDHMADSGDLFAEATLHRAISDLASVFQERSAEYVLVAGDLNVYSYSDGTALGDRAMTVLERLKSYGLEICGPFRPDDESRLDRCPCPDTACRHVNTYLYKSKPTSRPHQLDFFFATPALRERLEKCWADPDPHWFAHSDHRPIFAAFDL